MVKKRGFSFLFQYLRSHRKLIVQLILGLLLGTVFSANFSIPDAESGRYRNRHAKSKLHLPSIGRSTHVIF